MERRELRKTTTREEEERDETGKEVKEEEIRTSEGLLGNTVEEET